MMTLTVATLIRYMVLHCEIASLGLLSLQVNVLFQKSAVTCMMLAVVAFVSDEVARLCRETL